jgi:ABC-type Fe3+ transport system permease subunit/DNA-binding beta-propeller fold protein YncE
MNLVLLTNSLTVSATATLLALAGGFCTALYAAAVPAGRRNFLLALAITSFVMPPFLVTNSWIYFLGHNGVWRNWLSLDIFSLGGTIWILSLLLWPISFFATLAAWNRLEQSCFEIEPALTGAALVRNLLFPSAKSILAPAAVVIFVLALNNFAVPAILQTKVFPAEVWVDFNTTFSYRNALSSAWPLIAAPLLLLVWLRDREKIWWPTRRTIAPGLFRERLGRRCFRFGAMAALVLPALSVGLPLGQLVADQRTALEFVPALLAGQSATFNSFFFAAATAIVVVAFALLSWRRPFGIIAWLPMLLPGVLLGIALIWIFNRTFFAAFYQSTGIVILAYAIRYLAPGSSTVRHVMETFDRHQLDAARLDGAGAARIFFRVQLPQVFPQLAAAGYITYLLCLWDVETLVLIVPPGSETLALRIFNLLHYGHNAQVNALCVILLLLAVLPLVAWHTLVFFLKQFEQYNLGRTVGTVACAVFLAGCSPQSTRNQSIDSKLFRHVEIIGSRGIGLGQFNKPRSVAVDRNDNLYVVDMTGRVQKFSPRGEFLLSWQMPQTDLGKPKGMGRDLEGNIVVIEPHYQRVNHFSTGGKLLYQWGDRGTNAGQLFMPRAAVFNSRGEVLVAEYGLVERLQRFLPKEKKFLQTIGHAGYGPGEFNRPEGIAVDAHDRIYVADSCNHRIQILSATGEFIRAYGRAGSRPGEFSYPYDVRVDQQGRQYVCEFGNSRIQIFDEHDALIEVLGEAGGAPGQFNNPWSIALDSQGNLYVADSMNHRVQKFVRRQQQSAAKPTRSTAAIAVARPACCSFWILAGRQNQQPRRLFHP